MRTNSCTGIVSSKVCIYSRLPAFYNCGNEFLNQVRMRTPVACSLKEGNVVWIINFFTLGKVFDFLDQQFVGIRHIDSAGVLTAVENNVAFILKLLPFERHLCTVNIIAFAVLTNNVEK